MFMHDDLLLSLSLPLSALHTHPHTQQRTMPTYRQQRNVVVLVLHRSADVGGEERGGVRMYIYSATIWKLDRRYHGTPILYCTILHYTTRIYLSIRLRELVIRCASYLPTS